MKFIVISLLVLFAFNTLYAQKDSLKTRDYKNGIQLYFLTTPELSYTRKLSKVSAIRLGLEAESSSDFRNYNRENRYFRDTTLSIFNYNGSEDQDRYKIRLSMVYNYYMPLDEKLRWYAGLGPYIGRDIYIFRDTYTSMQSDDISKANTDIKSWSLGISFNAGVEYDISERVALLAEYRYRAEKIEESKLSRNSNPARKQYSEHEKKVSGSSWSLQRLRLALIFRL